MPVSSADIRQYGLGRGTLHIDAEFPDKLLFLFRQARYKVAYGGRASGKSWSFARALLLQGISQKMRVLCTREVQKSIKDSVHKLLSDQIEMMQLGQFYRVMETEIRGTNGTEFLFSGLSSQTSESLKSFEGVDVCWCEEAQSISDRSWKILVPTIRKEDSEIWVSFNPELETDPTYQRFVVNPPGDCISVPVNYIDNPYFNAVMESERVHCQKTDSDNYPNIWEGKCRPAVEGAIYFREIQQAEKEGRICHLPHDPALKAHLVFDLGLDGIAVPIVQKGVSELRVIDYVELVGQTIADVSNELKKRRYNWGRVWLPHDGFSGDVKTGMSSAAVLKRLGWDVATRNEIVEMSVEEGIKATRLTFPRIYFDKGKTERLIECLKRYRRRISRETLTAGSPLHDEHSHAADAMRYLCLNVNNMRNELDSWIEPDYLASYTPRDSVIGI